MFKDLSATPIVATADLARARAFYADTLGLDLIDENEEVLTFRTGKTQLGVYRSAEAGTNRANAVAWDAGKDFDTVVEELRGNGVRFEEYPDMGMDLHDGVHSVGSFRAVWFKDPDGNILHFNAM
ncbi:VOC family protein [Sphingomonas sp. AOB5]|uniref:VOC family protein n=1 Tax=Sphingomonas sp. AOB5 TaxID=3034017 RepID=UPI0023F7DB7E|nr:VOC family protein [Sphingomonas sp. AOB5]MDF7774983.1 VOC family protein [Sphingomonas sp. AOB5]